MICVLGTLAIVAAVAAVVFVVMAIRGGKIAHDESEWY